MFAKSMRNLVLLAGLGTSPVLQAATEFDQGLAPVELVREFTGGTLYKSLPDNFPLISLPADLDLRLIGSVDQFSNQRLLLRSSLGAEPLRERLRTALLAAGWVELGANVPTSSLSLCHDQHGSLQIRTSTVGSESRVHVSRSFWPLPLPQPNAQTCAQQEAAQSSSSSWHAFYLEQLPVLEVPAQTTTPALPLRPFASLSSSSGSAGISIDIEREGIIEVPDTTSALLFEHFAAQMTAQGWRKDSAGTGAKSATSVWYKTVAAPEFAGAEVAAIEFNGMLSLQNTAGNSYRVQLRLQALSATAAGIGSFYSIRDFVPYVIQGNGTLQGTSFLNQVPALGIRGLPSGIFNVSQ